MFDELFNVYYQLLVLDKILNNHYEKKLTNVWKYFQNINEKVL